MAVGSSLTDQIGIGKETTWGVYHAPTDFLRPADKPDFEPGERFIETLPYGRLTLRKDDSRQWEFGGAGTIVTDARIKGLDILLESIFGVGSSGVYTLSANPGVSYTVQQVRTMVGGTRQAFNHLGCVAQSLELAITTDQNPRITVAYDIGKTETTTAIATVSYPTDDSPFAFLDGVVTVDGGSLCVRSLTVRIERPMATERMCIGGVKKQQIGNGEIVVSGSMEVEFESMAAFNKFRTGDYAALNAVLSYGGGSLEVDIPVLTYRTNAFGGTIGDMNTETLDFKALEDTDPITTWTYTEAS